MYGRLIEAWEGADEETRARLKKLSPENYLGLAIQLAARL